MRCRCAYLPLSSFLFLIGFLFEQLLEEVHVQLQLVLLLSGQTLRLQLDATIQLPVGGLLVPEPLALLLQLQLLLLALLLQLHDTTQTSHSTRAARH